MAESDSFDNVVWGQFSTPESRITDAITAFKKFLKEGPLDSASVKEGYAEFYANLLIACDYDEKRAKDLIDECLIELTGPVSEFENMMRPLEEGQTEESKRDEWRMYSRDDPEFRQAIIGFISMSTGIKTGKEFFSNGEA